MNRQPSTTANCALAKPQVERLQYLEKCSHGRECRIHRSKPTQFCSGGPARAPPQASQDQNDPFSSVPERSGAGTDMVSFQNYAGLRGKSRGSHPYLHFLKNGRLSTCGFVFAIFCMVGGSLSSPVIRHSFVRGGPTARLSAGPAGHFCPAGPYSSDTPT